VLVTDKGNLAVRADIGAIAIRIGHIPASAGNVIDLLELVFGRRLTAGVVVRIPSQIGQSADSAGITIDRDRVCSAHHDLRAADSRAVTGRICYRDRTCAYGSRVTGGIADRGARRSRGGLV